MKNTIFIIRNTLNVMLGASVILLLNGCAAQSPTAGGSGSSNLLGALSAFGASANLFNAGMQGGNAGMANQLSADVAAAQTGASLANAASASGSSQQAATGAFSTVNNNSQTVNQCSQNSAVLHWTGVCQNAFAGANQGPCYCAAAALLRCYIQADPNDPSVGQWQQAYQQNLQNAQSTGLRCFTN